MNLKSREEIDPKNQMRWFHVSYSGVNAANIPIVGSLSFWSQSFPSLIWLQNEAIPAVAGDSNAFVPGSAIITYMYEFACEQDYANFVSGGDMDDAIGDLLA